MELITAGGKKITLNKGQQKAVIQIQEFLKKRGYGFMCLSGPAGSGKTTVIKKAIEGKENIIASAPTHKACINIQQVTGLRAITAHKLLSLRPNMDLAEFTLQNLLFEKAPPKKNEERFDVWVIDEASMLNAEIVKYIKQKAKETRAKVLFLGDKNQLPPVKEEISDVFTDSEIIHIELTKVERQQGDNPLFGIYDKILSDMTSPFPLYSFETNVLENMEGVRFTQDPKIFGLSAYDAIIEDSNSKILCFRNSEVVQWNKAIRRKTHGDWKVPLQKGDCIMSYRTVADEHEYTKILSQNSSEYKVSQVLRDCEKAYLNGCPIKVTEIELENLFDGTLTTIDFVVDEPQNYYNFWKEEQKRRQYAENEKGSQRGYQWMLYFTWRNKYFLHKDIYSDNGAKLVDKDFDYSSAITVHKSQGSTYNSVFIVKSDFAYCKDNAMRNRLEYVAFTRPSKFAFILY